MESAKNAQKIDNQLPVSTLPGHKVAMGQQDQGQKGPRGLSQDVLPVRTVSSCS